MKRFMSALVKNMLFKPISLRQFSRPVVDAGISKRFKSTLVMPTLKISDTLNVKLENHLIDYRNHRTDFDMTLEKCFLSGERKFENGDYSEALRDYQSILALLRGEEVNNLTKAQALLLAKAYTGSAEILSIGTHQDEKLALNYLDKALELVPNLTGAIELKRAILADNAISPLHMTHSNARSPRILNALLPFYCGRETINLGKKVKSGP